MSQKPVEVKLLSPSLQVIIEDKEYEIIIAEDGIFIRGDKPLEIVNQSKTGHWLLIK